MPVESLCRKPRDPALAGLVKEIWTMRSGEAGDDMGIEYLPADAKLELVFSLRSDTVWSLAGELRHPLAGHFLSGPRTAYRAMRARGPIYYVAASLRPGAARALFGPLASALGELDAELGSMPASSPFAEGAAAVEEAAETRDGVADAARLDALEAWLGALARRSEAPADDARLARALSAAASGRCRARSVAELAEALGLGYKRLERESERAFGLGPKALLRLGRFARARAAFADGREVDWAGLAAELGFADQSHLVREFGVLAGMSPEAWRRSIVLERQAGASPVEPAEAV